MDFTRISGEDVTFFKSVIGEANVLYDAESLEKYSHDETEDLRFPPEVVLKPSSPEEISSILSYCNERSIPVTPRGAGTGLSGGALPVFGGVILSSEKLNRILFIDERNHQVTVEPGVITQVLQDAVREKGLFYPPDPASKGSCFIGGNISENSGGPKAVKYGVVKDYVLNLEMVLPDGEIIWTGANVLKNATGYNLTQLVVGSEGTLGVVTKIVLRLIPHPQHDLLMLVPFKSATQACEAVNAVFQAGIIPSAMEFMERDAIDWAMRFVETNVEVADDVEAHLLIEVDGNDEEVLMKQMEKITDILQQFSIGEILFADTSDQKASLWKLRRSVAEAVKRNSVYKEEDTVVPRAELPALLSGVKSIGKKYGFKSVCYGHVGDGNLHVNVIKGDLSDEDWTEKLPQGIREIFQLCVKLGGTLSGEHGIGWVQKPYMDIAFNATQMKLMQQIKNVFDPNGILNPGKIFH
ncbi:MAG: FAD-binding protein [Bacteroidetes bacterium]|nr:FAD-binding protein [Bacteroidota bacterium]